MKCLIYNPKTNLFDFFIDSLIEEFNKKNIKVSAYENENIINNNNKNIINNNNNKNIINKSDILLIIVNPHFIFDYVDIKNTILSLSKQFKYKIFYITEPINFIIEKKVFKDIINMINPFAIWTYTYENFHKLSIKQPILKIFPNYNNSYNFINPTLSQLKNRNTNKIVFIGNITENRKDICDSFEDKLINYSESWSKDEWTNIISSNLFFLNIHRRVGCKSFESFRIIPILANGGFIISEKCNKIEEDIYSKFNIIFVERNEILSTFLNLINNNSISYQDIYNKTLLFRDTMNECKELNTFIDYCQKGT